MSLRDLISRPIEQAVESALAIAGAHLTDAQLRVLSAVLANQSQTEIERAFRTVLPPEEARTGALLPYATSGHLRDYPTRAHEIAVLVLGLADDDSWFSQSANTFARLSEHVQGGLADYPVGSNAYFAPRTSGPSAWRGPFARVSPGQLWGFANTTPGQLGVGFQGATELKGNMPSSSRGLGSSVPGDSADVLSTLRGVAGDDDDQ